MDLLTGTTPSRAAPTLMIARSGASADAPENTIAAFEAALDQGADALTVEVHLSRDDHPVVIRDFAVDRTTDGAGLVREHTVRALKRLDAGIRAGERFRGQRVQTLQEVFERFRDRTRFWIEIKGGSATYPGIEERLVSTIEVYEVEDRVAIQSFDTVALARIRDLRADLTLAAIVDRTPLGPILAAPGPIQAVCPRSQTLTERQVAAIRGAGLDCYAWTVSEPAQGRRLVEWGVSGLITDRPGLMRAGLGGQWCSA